MKRNASKQKVKCAISSPCLNHTEIVNVYLKLICTFSSKEEIVSRFRRHRAQVLDRRGHKSLKMLDQRFRRVLKGLRITLEVVEKFLINNKEKQILGINEILN